MNRNVQIVEDDHNLAMILSRGLTREGFDVAVDYTLTEALARLKTGDMPGLILTDIYLPDGKGLEILEHVKAAGQDVEVIVMTGNATVQSAVEAMKKGAYDYLLKPFQMEELVLTAQRVFHCRSLKAENRFMKEGRKTQFLETGIIGDSARMREILETVAAVASSRASVLIEGESGTGKELIAQAIHFNGNRAEKMFVPINCSAMPDNLIESELFGHAKGAFTGASEARQGLFSFAEGGTLFLDEIGDLSHAVQAKLLRVLEDGRVRRVGDYKEVEVDVRIVAATNRDISAMIRGGEFREDLYFRLAVIPILVPPLRERRKDIPVLVEHFIKRKSGGKAPETRFTAEAMDRLVQYDWPGNVRELKNILERLAILKRGKVIAPEDLPAEFRSKAAVIAQADGELQDYRMEKQKVLEEFHRRIVETALKKHGGNVSKASESLGLDRGNFQRIMRRYGLQSSEYREEG
ncbi:MAG: sigma-54-dependent transcriptional regulator [Syntrophaceae bacterium]